MRNFNVRLRKALGVKEGWEEGVKEGRAERKGRRKGRGGGGTKMRSKNLAA